MLSSDAKRVYGSSQGTSGQKLKQRQYPSQPYDLDDFSRGEHLIESTAYTRSNVPRKSQRKRYID